MAKLKATEIAKRVALEGMQMMGGYGYAVEYDMERHVRDRGRDDDLRRHERDPARHHRARRSGCSVSRRFVLARSRAFARAALVEVRLPE